MSDHAGAQADRRGSQERDKQEIERLFYAWKEHGDAACRDKIISQHLYLVQAVARKFGGLGESPEDLISEGMMGLINAVDLFDSGRGVQFATYATHLIDGQIRHYLRDKSKLIREPAWIQERLTRIARAAESLTHQLGRSATLTEIANEVELSEKQVREALKAQQRSRVTSLDNTRANDNDEGESRSEIDKLTAPLSGEDGLDVEDRIFLEQAMERLKPLEQEVLRHFYYLDLNQTEIARKLGISVNYASYLLRGALTKLKQAFEAQARVPLETTSTEAYERRTQGTLALYALPTQERPELSGGTAPEPYFRQALQHEVLRAKRYPQQFALLLVEPDGATERSDADMAAAMEELVAVTRRSVRLVDIVGRLGRWRLGLLLPQTGRTATVVAERLCQRAISGFTLSVGLAVFPNDGEDDAALDQRAIQALSKAQQNGGNQVCRLAGAPPAPASAPKATTPRKRKKTSTQ